MLLNKYEDKNMWTEPGLVQIFLSPNIFFPHIDSDINDKALWIDNLENFSVYHLSKL